MYYPTVDSGRCRSGTTAVSGIAATAVIRMIVLIHLLKIIIIVVVVLVLLVSSIIIITILIRTVNRSQIRHHIGVIVAVG